MVWLLVERMLHLHLSLALQSRLQQDIRYPIDCHGTQEACDLPMQHILHHGSIMLS